MNKHKVKFIRGSKTIWDQLNTTPEKIDNNTLYFIYEDEDSSVGKLYLGQRLITDDKIINIKDIGDIQIDNESLIDKQILIYNEENQEWKNSSLEEIIDLSNYYTKDEIDSVYHKTITSTNRPPMGAPVEVDIDLLRVGDIWILSGANIIYKLVEAQYNYQPAPSAEPYHRFIWQPLNERYGIGNTEPSTSATYQMVVYTINEIQWSWLPVPEYSRGDHYQMLVDGESTYYICKSGNMADTGVCTYIWREEGGPVDAYTKAETNALLADKMDLAPLDPTAAQIVAMPSGQLYGDTVNHKGTIKGGQEFYDTEYMDDNFVVIKGSTAKQEIPLYIKESKFDDYGLKYKSLYLTAHGTYMFSFYSHEHSISAIKLYWQPVCFDESLVFSRLPATSGTANFRADGGAYVPFGNGQIINVNDVLYTAKLTITEMASTYISYSYTFEKYVTNGYTKTEIDQKGYLTLETLPIYDGTVI